MNNLCDCTIVVYLVAAILFATRAVDQCRFNFILFLRVYTEIALPLLVGCIGVVLTYFPYNAVFDFTCRKREKKKTPPEVSLLCGQVILILRRKWSTHHQSASGVDADHK